MKLVPNCRLRFSIFILMFLALFAGRSMADDPSSAPKLTEAQIAQFEKQIETARERLKLTAEQQKAIEPILTKGFEEIAAILKSNGISKDKKADLKFREKLSLRRALNAVRDKMKEQLDEILTDEQMEEHQNIQQELRDKIRKRIGN
jgi:hypothetical protein